MWLKFSPCCNKHLNVYLPSWENTKSYCKCRFCLSVKHTHVNDNVNIAIRDQDTADNFSFALPQMFFLVT